MNLFEDIGTSRIILNEKYLYQEYSPTEIFNRDKEINQIASNIKSFIKLKTPQHLFVYGSPGTGKTTCAQHVTQQLEEYTTSIIPLYINCWEHSTSLSIYSEIATALRLPIPRRGVAKDEVASRILEMLKKDRKFFVLVLDELDGLVKQGIDFLYFASRSPFLSIVGISNQMDFLANLDNRVRSSLQFSTLEFKEYSYLDLKTILMDRASKSLLNGSWNVDLIDIIAKKASSTGDARFAIGLLLKAAQNAEKRMADKIERSDIPASLYDYRWKGAGLSDTELAVLNFLKDGEKTSSEIYDHLSSEGFDLSKRRIRSYLESLVHKDLINQRELQTGSFLKPKMYQLVQA